MNDALRDRISAETASAEAEYRAAMLPVVPAAQLSQRVVYAVRLKSGWVVTKPQDGPESYAPKFTCTKHN